MSEWDSDLMDSQKKLGDIASDVRRIQVAQNELDTNLDTIFAYQMELKSTLEVQVFAHWKLFGKKSWSLTGCTLCSRDAATGKECGQDVRVAGRDASCC